MGLEAAGTFTALSGTSTAVPIPAHDSGMLLCLVVGATASGTSPMVSSPALSGWTGPSPTSEAGNASAVRLSFYYKYGDGAETSVTVGTWSVTVGGFGQVLALNGRASSSPVDDSDITQQESGVDIDSPAGTASEDDVDVVWGFIFDDDVSTSGDHDSDGGWQGASQGYGEDSTPGNGFAGAVSYVNLDTGTIPASTYSSNGDTDAGVAGFIAFLAGAAGTTVTPGVIVTTTTIPTPTTLGFSDWSDTASDTTDAAAGTTVTPGVIVTTSTVPTPTPQGEAATSPGAIATQSTVPTPSAQGEALTTPDEIVTTTTVPTPTVTGEGAASPDEIVTTSTVPTPTPAGQAVATPDDIATSSTVPGPAISIGKTVTPDEIVTTTTVPTPTPLGEAVVTVTTIVTSTTVPTPTPTAGQVVAPDDIATTTEVPTPTPLGGGAVSPDEIVTSSTVPTPTALVPSTAAPDEIVTTSTVPGPSPLVSATATPNVIVTTVTLPLPGVKIPATTTPATIATSVAMPAATPVGGTGVTPDVIATLVAILQPLIGLAELDITALAYYQFFRTPEGNLVLAPVGRSARVGFKSAEGFERVSDTIRIDHDQTGQATTERAMLTVTSAWAANAGAAAATLQTALHTALNAAGFRGQGGVTLS